MLKRDFFQGTGKTNWSVVALAVLIDAALLVLLMRVVLPWLGRSFPISQLSGGLIQPTLLFSLGRFLIVGLGVALLLGGLKCADLGLVGGKLKQAVLVLGALWLVSQLVWSGYSLIAGQSITLSSIWRLDNLLSITGELLAQFGGNALAEEVIFRGFLLAQIYLLLKALFESRRRLAWTALLTSQFIFAISHIPQRLLNNPEPLGLALNLTMVMAVGLLFGLLYMRTNNLFIAIGLHALVNSPITLLAPPSFAANSLAPLVMILVLLLLWSQIEAFFADSSRLALASKSQNPGPSIV